MQETNKYNFQRRKVKQPTWSRRKSLMFQSIFITILVTPFIMIFFHGAESSELYHENPILVRMLFLFSPIIFFALFWLNYGIEALRNKKKQAQRSEFAIAHNFTYVPYPLNVEGFDITAGSVIAHGQGLDGYKNLWSGTRSGYSFRAIDYSYLLGRGYVSQTIICITMQRTNLKQFSIVNDWRTSDALAAKKVISDKFKSSIPKGFVAAVDIEDKYTVSIPVDFLNLFLKDSSFNAEFLGDRLLVYNFRKKLNGDDLLKALDHSVGLAKSLYKIN